MRVHEVDERHGRGLGDIERPQAVAAGAALDFSVRPAIAQRERQHDRRRALRLHVGDHLAHVPAERVHGFVLVWSVMLVDLLRLVAEPGNASRARRRRLVVDRAAVVVAKLNQTVSPAFTSASS